MTFSLFFKEFTLSDPLISAGRLFHSRIVLGKKDFENISLRLKGTRSELFLRRLYASVLWGIRLQVCLKYLNILQLLSYSYFESE